ncbi:MBOAT family O-acyltransferase [uncultured Brevundimonas sp.]|uniref:MBOAT family O-acyltransferase n=1 Tax=uncultured Brevundimonas sp. TaxID=213418 RepID=UPI0030EF9164|tara:strand:+ start:25827 stop:27287 length:1461 start_codon:yes stop_codon:yes gene_type:complete
MNFASPLFILLFLPVVMLAFHAIRGPTANNLRAGFLIIASVAFYLWTGLHNATVLAFSLTVTFACGRLLTRLDSGREPLRRGLMWLGVAANIGLLAAFKISAMDLSNADGFRTEEHILIPLGLSYVTFQQIGFIVACRRRQITAPSLRDYLFFITFFPHLIMGPIVRFRDMADQLRERCLSRVTAVDVSTGLSIFVFGLAQKVLLADQIAPAVDRIFQAAQAGPISPFESWFGIVAFQMQLYFDFVAYGDMAIGLARMFGIRLPINFDRPLFATDRFDLWRRWHITFAIFMRTHVFQPLVRRRRVSVVTALAITGILSGLWHGLGWTFVVWGLMQTAILLVVHERRRRNRRAGNPDGFGRWMAIALTFLSSALLGAMFRAPTLDSAAHVYGALLGLGATWDISAIGRRGLMMLPLCMLVAWGLPNSAQFFGRYWNALDLRPEPTPSPPHRLAGFRLTPVWALTTAATLVLCLCLIDDARRFVYVQF